MATSALSLLTQADAKTQAAGPTATEQFMAPTPGPALTDEDFEQMVHTGRTWQGIQVRDASMTPAELNPYFEGTFKITHHVYVGQDLITYDKGAYAIPQTAVYVGTFTYFAQPTDTDVAYVFPKGSFVIVGKKLTPDGKSETGIYIAEEAVAGSALNFIKATPAYLDDFQRRHARAADAYQRQAAAQAAGPGFDFGQMLALGLGAAMISQADLPGIDKGQLGQAFVKDVLGDGDGAALINTFVNSAQGIVAGKSMFSGGMNFQAPGLNRILSSLPQGTGSDGSAGFDWSLAPAGAAGPTPKTSSTTVSTGSAGTTENFNFTCPMGGNYTIPVSYKHPACGAAMKNFARVYSCNLIDDFRSAGQQCQQACGDAQCAER